MPEFFGLYFKKYFGFIHSKLYPIIKGWIQDYPSGLGSSLGLPGSPSSHLKISSVDLAHTFYWPLYPVSNMVAPVPESLPETLEPLGAFVL